MRRLRTVNRRGRQAELRKAKKFKNETERAQDAVSVQQ
jgi:hypothetical protein